MWLFVTPHGREETLVNFDNVDYIGSLGESGSFLNMGQEVMRVREMRETLIDALGLDRGLLYVKIEAEDG